MSEATQAIRLVTLTLTKTNALSCEQGAIVSTTATAILGEVEPAKTMGPIRRPFVHRGVLWKVMLGPEIC